jgi:hypothetical protein
MAIDTTNTTKTAYDPTTDPLYIQLENELSQKFSSDQSTLDQAKAALSDYLQSHPLKSGDTSSGFTDTMPDGSEVDTTEAHRQDDTVLAQLQKAIDDAQTQVDTDNSGKAADDAAILSYVQSAHDGQEIIDEAEKAGEAARVDVSNMQLADLVKVIMGACNNMTDDIAEMIAKDLQACNAAVAKMNSELQQLNSYLPATDGTKDPDVVIPSSLVTDIASNGVEVPKDATTEPMDQDATQTLAGAGVDITKLPVALTQTKMKRSDLTTFIENIKTQIETENNSQTAQLQALNKANNNHNERSDMISHLIDTLHETDSHALQ